MNERWLSVAEIAAHLGVNPDTIYKWIERRKMPAHKVGRLWKFMASEVDAWIRAGKAGNPDELGAVVALLASPRAAFLQGVTLAVDGGFMKGI